MSATAPTPLPNSYWVLPGRLLAGEHPAGPTPEATRERLGRLLGAGIECFVDLTEPTETEAYDGALPLSIEYQRKPIPDHGLPERREHMLEILGCLREALRERKPVYVHCRAGIGRTGMVVGCLLAEEGAAEALEALNRLWRQSERSREWERVPETDAQAEYIRLWQPGALTLRSPSDRSGSGPEGEGAEPGPADPLLQAPALAAARALRERFLGALLGLAVGDAVAAPTQFRRPGSFAQVGDLIGGGPFSLPPGGWSDDTAMALCLAESLLERGFDPADQTERYCRWQREGYLSATGRCLGITASAARALAASQWRRQPFSGSHDPKQLDPEPLSRVAPVVMYFFASPDEAVRMAGEAARTTCQSSTVLAACRTLAHTLILALSGRPKAEILAQAAAQQPHRGAARGAGQALSGAMEAFAATANYRQAVLHSANLGGDSDVASAVCGQIAGAFYGAGAIPAAWRESLMRRPLIEGYADRLLAHALTQMG